jgi:hypothetical protein
MAKGQNIWKSVHAILTVISIIFLASMSFSNTLGGAPGAEVIDATSQFCAALSSFLPIIAMLLIIIAAVIYASGQIMGAETRARANVWSTAAATGAVMAVLISLVAPPILSVMYGSEVRCTAQTCNLNCPGQYCTIGTGNNGIFPKDVQKCLPQSTLDNSFRLDECPSPMVFTPWFILADGTAYGGCE